MPFAIAAVGASLASSFMSSSSSSNAANAQVGAAENATAAQLAMFRETRDSLFPYMTGGTNALNALQVGLGLTDNPKASGFGSLSAGLSPDAYMKSPGYAWQFGEGQRAVSNAAAAHGGINSGNTLKALTSYGQGMANTDYYQALNAQMAQQQQRYGMLSNLMGTGESAAAGVGDIGAKVGAQIGSNMIGAGNAQAAGIVGSSNALTGGLNQLAYLGGQFGGQMTPQGFDFGGNGAFPTGGGVGITDTSAEASIYSDRDLKTDIKEEGETKNGLKVYSYRMKGSPKTEVGLMADEVEKVAPTAVKRDRNTGYKKVNYLKALRAKAA